MHGQNQVHIDVSWIFSLVFQHSLDPKKCKLVVLSGLFWQLVVVLFSHTIVSSKRKYTLLLVLKRCVFVLLSALVALTCTHAQHFGSFLYLIFFLVACDDRCSWHTPRSTQPLYQQVHSGTWVFGWPSLPLFNPLIAVMSPPLQNLDSSPLDAQVNRSGQWLQAHLVGLSACTLWSFLNWSSLAPIEHETCLWVSLPILQWSYPSSQKAERCFLLRLPL